MPLYDFALYKVLNVTSPDGVVLLVYLRYFTAALRAARAPSP